TGAGSRGPMARPRDTLRPTTPQQDAGMRIEPPPSLACAMGTRPAATAAADPPEEPPLVRVKSHGFFVGPGSTGSVVGVKPNSGVVDLPSGTSPDASSAST